MDEINPQGHRFFRRKKRWQGATWTPTQQSAAVEDGAWCKSCRQRHGYKSPVLKAAYEKASNGKWRILWTCSKTGNVIETTNLGGTSV
jgi:hypothetical protein